MPILLLLGLFLPLLGFITLMVFNSVTRRRAAGLLASSVIGLSFLCFLVLLCLFDGEVKVRLFSWISLRDLNAEVAFTLDSLSLLMALIVTGVGFLIHVYSMGYMEHESDPVRYFACMNFFIFAMLLLVLASNLLLLFVGWEGVGLASYLLIGFWFQREAAAAAATKAFIVNRVGDAAFLLALVLTFYLFGTSDIEEVAERAPHELIAGGGLATLLALLYLGGATGKSAQLPLQVWLPDAMEGPTPVSALIHAATMVTAGVYLLVRLQTLYLLAPWASALVATIGALTALYGALSAAAQADLKRVLAYSTISQLGLMFLACGVGALYAAIFHLFSHAFIKALLFLSAGNVIHGMHGETNMFQMGGLKAIFNKTHWLFLIGLLALAGLPPTVAFFSKELILEVSEESSDPSLYIFGFIASMMTAFYLTRAYCLTFLGRVPPHLQGVHEAPNVMLLPLAVLALFSLFGGVFIYHGALQRFLLESSVTLPKGAIPPHFPFTWDVLMATLAATAAAVFAALLYTRYLHLLRLSCFLFGRGLFFNEVYNYLIVIPCRSLASFIASYSEPLLYRLAIFYPKVCVINTSSFLKRMQSGLIRSYVAWLTLGSGAVVIYFLFLGPAHV